MKYRSNKHGDFAVIDGRSYRIEREFYNDPDSVAPHLVPEMFERLGQRKTALTILTIGDANFALLSREHESGEHLVQLTEVRGDDKGHPIKKPLPKIGGKSQVPIIGLLGSIGEVQINSVLDTDAMGSVAQILQQGIHTTLQENAQQHSGG